MDTKRIKKILWTLISFNLSIYLPSLIGINTILILDVMLVLSIHELGHFAVMKFYGYEDINMTFIPFWGANVTSSTYKDKRIRKTWIYLSGPVPGIFLGLICKWLVTEESYESLKLLGNLLIYINLINLLPLAVLDGGQIFENLFFTKSRQIAWFNFITGKLFVGYCILSKSYYLLPYYLFFLSRFYFYYINKKLISYYRIKETLKPKAKIPVILLLVITILLVIVCEFFMA